MYKISLNKIVVSFKMKKHFWIFLSISTIIFSLWWAAYYPGIMSPDSIDQWRETLTGKLGDWHPYFHTIYLYLLRLIFNSPAIVSLFQVIFTSLLFSAIFSFFIEKGVNKKIIYLFFVLFITSIPVALLTVTLWKDVPFSLCMIGLVFLLYKQFIEKRLTLSTSTLIVVMAIGASFFRHNGVINLLLFPIIIGTVFRGISRKASIIMISAYAVLFFAFSFVLPKILNVEPAPSFLNKSIIYQESVSYLQPFPFWSDIPRVTPKTEELLERVMPKAMLLKKYDPRYPDFIFFPSYVNRAAMTEEFWNELTKEFFSYNLPRNLNFFIGDRVTMFVTTTLGFGNTSDPRVYENDIGLKASPLSDKLYKLFQNIALFSLYPTIWRIVIWNSLLPILLLIFLFIDSLYRKNRPITLCSGILLLHVTVLFVAAPASDWRYYYFAYLSIFLSIPLWLLGKNLSKAQTMS